MVEAATEFAKAGENEADAAQLAKVAAMYQNIADEQISAGEAAEFLIAQMKAFNISADDSIHIIDSVNNVSNNMAVSSADLARNLGNMSAAMAVGGNTMEESIGLLTGITEITRSAASASRALVTIQSRFNQIVDESSSTGQSLLKWYTKHGIAVKDDAGQLRSLYDVMSDLAPKWNSLTKNEQSYFMQQQAGARQSQNLAALLSNFKGVQEATELAYNSSGSAAAENAKVLESLEAKTTALKATWEDFANKTINSELVKSLLNLANGALKILNTGVGRTITQFTLLSGVFVGLGGVIAQVVPAIIAAFKGVKIAAVGASAAMQGFKASIPVVGVVLAALSTAILFVTSAIDKQNQKFKELEQSVDAANDAYNDAIATANANEMQAKSLVGTIEELNKVTHLSEEQQYRYESAVNKLNELYPDLNLNIDKHTGKIKENTDAIYDRIEAMKQEALQVAVQEKQSAQYKIIADAQLEQYKIANESRDEFIESLQQAQQNIKDFYATNADLAMSEDLSNMFNVDLSKLDYGELISYYDKLTSLFTQDGVFVSLLSVDGEIRDWERYQKTIDEAQNELKILAGVEQSVAKTRAELNAEEDKADDGAAAGVAKMLDDAIARKEAQIEAAQSALERAQRDSSDKGLFTAEELDGAKEKLAQLRNELTQLERQRRNIVKDDASGERQLENADKLKSAYDALNNAISDYAEYGQLQAKTQEELNVALPGVIDYLYDEDGALTDAGKSALAGSRKLADFAVAQKEAEVNTKKATLEFIRQATALDLIRFEGIMPSEGDLEAQIKKAEGELDYLKLLQELAAQKEAADADKSSKLASSATSTYKKAFTDWLAYKDHQLAMDEITEEQYYAELTEMVDKFFKGRAEYQEEYWQYSEKIYAYEKKRMQELVEESTKAVEDAVDKINEKYDSELSRLEEVNDALSDQIEYEKLLDEMAKAREQKKLVYKDGRFQYVQDVDAISAAQAKLDEYNRNKSLEASKADIEARRKAEVRQTILDKMQANSAAWATSTSPAEREALHNANVELAKLLEDNSTYDAATGKWSSYAGGTLGAAGGMSLVGENGPEMRILNRGDGILTSGVTKNLFAWGSTSPSDFVSALKGLMGVKLGSSSNTTVNVSNLELPNVTNAREFVTGLKNLALQYAYERG